jgi:molybdopterin synthase sulfur carrier subunit
MIVTIKYFGLLAEVTNKSEEQLQLDQETISIDGLQSILESLYQGLQKTTYAVAVNQTICMTDVEIKNQDVIAFLPPFAGG